MFLPCRPRRLPAHVGGRRPPAGPGRPPDEPSDLDPRRVRGYDYGGAADSGRVPVGDEQEGQGAGLGGEAAGDGDARQKAVEGSVALRMKAISGVGKSIVVAARGLENESP